MTNDGGNASRFSAQANFTFIRDGLDVEVSGYPALVLGRISGIGARSDIRQTPDITDIGIPVQ